MATETTTYWRSLYREQTGHYSTYALARGADGMAALRLIFPTAQAGEMNFALFSTSGVHGSYALIEDSERAWRANRGLPLDPPYGANDDERERLADRDEERRTDPDAELFVMEITFLVVHPRLVTTRHGNVTPQTEDDWAFLRRLRETSWAAVQQIGKSSD